MCPCVVAISKIPIIVERERRSWKNKKRLTIVSECVRETGTLQNHRQIYNLNARKSKTFMRFSTRVKHNKMRSRLLKNK